MKHCMFFCSTIMDTKCKKIFHLNLKKNATISLQYGAAVDERNCGKAPPSLYFLSAFTAEARLMYPLLIDVMTTM